MSFIDIRQQHQQRQSQTLSPRLQHAVRLLQMSSLEFAATLRDTLGTNPFLESDEGEADSVGQPLPGVAGQGPAFDDAGVEFGGDHGDRPLGDPGNDRDFDDGDGGSGSGPDGDADLDASSDRDLWNNDVGAGVRRVADGALSALDMVAVEAALNSHLHSQLRLLPLGPRDLLLAQTIVESLDDDGYLRTPLEELLAVVPTEPAAVLADLQIALRRVQSLDPAGVGARSVGECLLLQLPAIDCSELRALAQRIVGEHLPALAARDIGGLARRLAETPARVEAACDRIRRLDARPGWRHGSTRVAYVVPDVVVKKSRGRWAVQLNPAVVPRWRLNQVYAQMFQRHRTAQNAEMGADLEQARWTVRNVEQRFSTILDVARAIVDRQRNFLDYGAMAMKPLGLREIADAVGVHESTVSRATNNKYLATPTGVYELKSFFSRSMVSANGSACSGTAIRGLVKDILDAERRDAPLSDAEITRQLAQQGLVVARRTVTKYRQMLKIEAVERRRRHG